MLSLTESDLCKDASVFQTLSNFQLLSQYWAARLQLVTGSVMANRNDERSLSRGSGGEAELHRFPTSHRFRR